LASGPTAASADDGIVDVHGLPKLEGAEEDTSRSDPYRVTYRVPTAVPATTAATRKMFVANGWVPS
jgi:hypothetical protein